MDERLAKLEERVEHLTVAIDKLVLHVDSLRQWQAYILGAGAVIGALVSWVVTR